MLSRREVLIGATAAGAAALVRGAGPVFARASQPSTPVNFDVPAGACDCHVHVFGDPRRFPLAASRTYTPEQASVAEMRALHRALHTGRVVIVNPSIYGADNACTLDGIKQLGSIARGIAVIDEKTPEAALDEMDRAGIRGIRVNLETSGVSDPAVARRSFTTAVERIKGRSKWHIQVYTRLSVIEGIKDLVMAAPMPIVFDHFGGAQGALGVRQTGFDTLLNLVHTGRAYVKISAPYRSSTKAPNYPDVAPLAKALIAANPQRMLWGSDWPHPDSTQFPGRKFSDLAPLQQIDDGRVMNLLPDWAPDAAVRKTILVENPANLYGF
jgi:predicted TIM-barrel fold metal-dependent hydrolase